MPKKLPDTAFLTAEDFNNGKLQQWIDEKHIDASILYPGVGNVEQSIKLASFIIATGDSHFIESIKKLVSPTPLPPVLLIIRQEQVEEPYSEILQPHFFNILLFPFPYRLLANHLQILQKLHQLQDEKHAFTKSLSKQLDILSKRDGLTGLFNRRALIADLQQQLTRASEDHFDLSIFILNIDNFKRVNHKVGREHGDILLNELAARLTQAAQDQATCYRFSGEDFIIVSPDTNEERATKLARQMSNTCQTKPFLDGAVKQYITVSIGIASFKEHKPKDLNEFLTMAETALFIAKAEGRNRIKSYPREAGPGKGQNQHTLLFVRRTIERLLEKTRSATISSLKLLALNIAGPDLQEHIQNVSTYMKLLGKRLGLPDDHIQTFENAVALHTCFKLMLHSDLVKKAETLNPGERKVMNDLPLKLTELAETFDYFAHERYILETHGEKYDGSGYPYGLKGDEIPLGARIFNIVDSVIAMNSERPYRRRLTGTEILQELKVGAGKQFDPFLVLQLLSIIRENNLLGIDHELLTTVHHELITKFPVQQ